ncbi:MAG: hypothetical protein ACXVJQ_19410 [Acidimicrobiia bacterium]
MIRRLRPSARRRDERGVSLVLVLVALVVFGLLVPVLGQFGTTNGVSGYLLKGQRFDRYAAESGLQGAIAWARTQRSAGRAGMHCPDTTADALNGGSPNAARAVTVKCAGFDLNGVPQSTPTMPQYALLTLGRSGNGITMAGGTARTDGAWYSGAGIDASGAALDASADYVGAAGSCRGVTASPTDCNTGKAADDPSWPLPDSPPSIAVDPIRPTGRNLCSAVVNGVVRVDPGLHWQREFFDALGDGDCGNVTIWLSPGDGTVPHVFDFTFYGDTSADWPIHPAGSRVAVVSGTLGASGATCDPNAVAAPVLAASTFTLAAGSGATVDLCGQTGSGQRLALAQVLHGTNPRQQFSPQTVPNRIQVAPAPPAFDFPSAPPGSTAALAGIDCIRTSCRQPDQYLSGTIRGRRATGTVTMTLPDPVGAAGASGASVRLLTVDITHREQPGNRDDLQRVRVWISGLPTGFTSCALTDPNHQIDSSRSWTTARTDQLTCDLSGFHQPYFPAGSLQVNVAVDLTNGTRIGDVTPTPSVELDLDHVAVSATMTRAGTRDSRPGSSDILTIGGGAVATFDGTVYLPSGNVGADFGGAPTASGFRRGLVAATVDVTDLPDDPAFAPFSLPGGGNYTDRLATFQAFVSGDPKPMVTARVRFCDVHPEGGTPTTPCTGAVGGPPQILSWDPRR